MKIKNLQYHINYKEVWEEMRRERRKKLKISYNRDFFQKFATDFSKQIKFGDYEFGRKATEILKEILAGNFEILEIGPGPGTLTIPLSKMVKKIIGIELSEVNIKHLKENLKQNHLKIIIRLKNSL
ncbi:MAG: class I SAM-dependent methyltransferase [Candidatus Caldatribacteriota bacterium]|nr:class I SAM-dependent methyltransferase [Candidatus Caldatribacteriota bacterium]